MLLKWLKISDLASFHGASVDSMNEFVHWVMLILGLGWCVFLGYVFWRFRAKKNPKADYHGVRSHASTHIEISVVLVEAILLIGFALPFWFQRAAADSFPTSPDVVRVRAVAYQFGWTFHYPGPDGKFGRVHHDFYLTHPAGLDTSDPNAADDFVSMATLQVPINRPTVVQVTSKDVIHGLSIHATRTSQDAIPGVETPTWFKATQTGEWDIICAQLCGAGHGSMKGTFKAVSEQEFDKWVRESAPKPAAAAPAPPAGNP